MFYTSIIFSDLSGLHPDPVHPLCSIRHPRHQCAPHTGRGTHVRKTQIVRLEAGTVFL